MSSSFHLIGTNAFHIMKPNKERFSAVTSRCRRFKDYVKNCTKKDAARVVRLFFRIRIVTVIFLPFTYVMRRPCWCKKQWQNVAHVLHNIKIKFPKYFFRYFSALYTNMAAVAPRKN